MKIPNSQVGPALTFLFVIIISLSSCGSSVEEKASFRAVPSNEQALQATPTDTHLDIDTIIVDGTLYTVWVKERDLGNTHDLWFAETPVGDPIEGEEVQLTDDPEDARRPSIAVTPSGDVAVVWEEGTIGTRSIRVATMGRSETSFSPVGTIADGSGGEDHTNPNAYYAGTNELHVVWENDEKIWYRRQGTLGGAFANAVEVPGELSYNASDPSVTAQGNDVIVVWRASEDFQTATFEILRAASSLDRGVTWSEDIGTLPGPGISLPVVATAGDYIEPEVSAGGFSGQFYVVYKLVTGSKNRIRCAHFSNYGETAIRIRDVYIADTEDASDPSIIAQFGSVTEVYVSFTRGGAVGEIDTRVSLNAGEDWGPFGNWSQVGNGQPNASGSSVVTVWGDNLVVAWQGQNATSGIPVGFVADSDISGRFDE